jgi:hypothetical protein
MTRFSTVLFRTDYVVSAMVAQNDEERKKNLAPSWFEILLTDQVASHFIDGDTVQQICSWREVSDMC